jgi:hypothetical protein
MIYLGLCGIVILLVFLWVISNTTKKRWVFMISVPSIIVLFAITFQQYYDDLGYPTNVETPEQFFVLSYFVQKPHIYLWTITKENKIPRSYMIDYNKNTNKNLNKMKSTLKKIGIISGKKTKVKNPGVDKSKSEFLFYPFNPQDFISKDDDIVVDEGQ